MHQNPTLTTGFIAVLLLLSRLDQFAFWYRHFASSGRHFVDQFFSYQLPKVSLYLMERI
ncbi:unnamed protein product [Protopolystoma xenopodis]|uniref:Uncharacterized protein n=1 Tax=Protopolystoma xenopodis TaxID=117903 RepID=A0A3S5AVX0_9PLAT|nr:unnamed protein product [Protopolystoma xenopodis]